TLPLDQAARRELDVEHCGDVAAPEVPDACLERIEPAGRIRGADEGADRGAAHDLGNDAECGEALDDADVRPAASGAAAEREADFPSHGHSPDSRDSVVNSGSSAPTID